MTDKKRRELLKKIYAYTLLIVIPVAINEKVMDTSIKFVNKEFNAMGTNGKIQIFTDNEEKASSIAEEAIKRMQRIDELASKFAPDSDIAILNRLYKMYNNITEETEELLETSNKYYDLTEGYFDIGLGNILTLANIDKNLPINGNFLKKSDFKNKIVDIKKNKAKIIRHNTTLDLGGIAKGYALDEAMKIFKYHKIEHVAIELGGDIKVNGGMNANTPWTITLDNKISQKDNKNATLKLYSGGVAISASYVKKSPDNNTFKHHIINPKLLKSMEEYKFTMVSGEDSMTCDILSTAAFNMNNYEVKKLKNKFKNYDIRTDK